MTTSDTKLEPDTDFEFIKEWFEKARDRARAAGKSDSASLWDDGLKHLMHFKALSERTPSPAKVMTEEYKLFSQICHEASNCLTLDGTEYRSIAKILKDAPKNPRKALDALLSFFDNEPSCIPDMAYKDGAK